MQDFEKIYQQYFQTVYKYLVCLTHNSDIAEDLTQETFCKAYLPSSISSSTKIAYVYKQGIIPNYLIVKRLFMLMLKVS